MLCNDITFRIFIDLQMRTTGFNILKVNSQGEI